MEIHTYSHLHTHIHTHLADNVSLCMCISVYLRNGMYKREKERKEKSFSACIRGSARAHACMCFGSFSHIMELSDLETLGNSR